VVDHIEDLGLPPRLHSYSVSEMIIQARRRVSRPSLPAVSHGRTTESVGLDGDETAGV
jgi:hypothetical protein